VIEHKAAECANINASESIKYNTGSGAEGDGSTSAGLEPGGHTLETWSREEEEEEEEEEDHNTVTANHKRG